MEITMKLIRKEVCEYYNMPEYIIDLECRKREIVEARQICMYFSEQSKLGSLAKIGKFFGGKDHATVLHAKKTVNNMKDTDKSFLNRLEDIKRRIFKPYYTIAGYEQLGHA